VVQFVHDFLMVMNNIIGSGVARATTTDTVRIYVLLRIYFLRTSTLLGLVFIYQAGATPQLTPHLDLSTIGKGLVRTRAQGLVRTRARRS
jgi:uncharacterized protein YaaW (UPF0174 family)